MEAAKNTPTASEILEAAEVLAKDLPANLKFYTDRKIAAARSAGTLQAAVKAGDDIVMIIEKIAPKTPQKVYTMKTEGYPGCWLSNFNFHAASQQDADNKAFDWARYHGMRHQEVKAEEATGEAINWECNDNYVS